jgi:hypothetical protein
MAKITIVMKVPEWFIELVAHYVPKIKIIDLIFEHYWKIWLTHIRMETLGDETEWGNFYNIVNAHLARTIKNHEHSCLHENATLCDSISQALRKQHKELFHYFHKHIDLRYIDSAVIKVVPGTSLVLITHIYAEGDTSATNYSTAYVEIRGMANSTS